MALNKSRQDKEDKTTKKTRPGKRVWLTTVAVVKKKNDTYTCAIPDCALVPQWRRLDASNVRRHYDQYHKDAVNVMKEAQYADCL